MNQLSILLVIWEILQELCNVLAGAVFQFF